MRVGTQNYICPTTQGDLIARQYCEEPDSPAPLCFLEMAQEIMTEHNLRFPQTVNEAIDLYVTLTAIIETHF